MDKLTKKARSENMAQIKNKNTKPEILVRKFLFSKGLRFRKNDKRYPGCPDIVLPKYKTAIFVNGCFWHCHEGCKDFVIPKTNVEFWKNKLHSNKERDRKKHEALMNSGWRVIVIWECELKKSVYDKRLNDLYEIIIKNIARNERMETRMQYIDSSKCDTTGYALVDAIGNLDDSVLV